MRTDWEPVKPTLAVATEAYQLLYELSRAHPEDPQLIADIKEAYDLMEYLWKEHHGIPLDSVLVL